MVRENRRRWLLKYCNLPFGTEEKTFSNFDTKGIESLEMALSLASQLAEGGEEVRWLTLLSMTDRGKTHLAIAVCRRYLERGVPAKFVVVPEMLRDLRDSFDFEGEMSYRTKFHLYLTVPLLVLDDLGMENRTKWSREQIQEIINARANSGLPLIVTSNLPLEVIMGERDDEERLASMRMASRLQREDWCRVVLLDAPENRLTKKEAR
jgi:DNA replication protein DnaC